MEWPNFLLITLSVVLGGAVGSFLNVVILRGFRGESLRGRSYCETCRNTLSLRELIPILSFLIQKGWCRNCGSRLFWQYPFVEAAAAASFGLAAWLLYPNYVLLLAAFAAMAASIVIIVSDLKYYLIPDKAVLALLGVGIFLTLARGISLSWTMALYDALLALTLSAIPALLWLFSRGRWMGLGDAKLFLALSLLVGFPLALPSFLFSFWAGGLAGTVLLLGRKMSFGSRLPFAPFIVVGTLLSLFLGQKFLDITGLSTILDFMLQ